MLEASVGDPRFGDFQTMEAGQPFKVLQARVGDLRAVEGQPLEVARLIDNRRPVDSRLIRASARKPGATLPIAASVLLGGILGLVRPASCR